MRPARSSDAPLQVVSRREGGLAQIVASGRAPAPRSPRRRRASSPTPRPARPRAGGSPAGRPRRPTSPRRRAPRPGARVASAATRPSAPMGRRDSTRSTRPDAEGAQHAAERRDLLQQPREGELDAVRRDAVDSQGDLVGKAAHDMTVEGVEAEVDRALPLTPGRRIHQSPRTLASRFRTALVVGAYEFPTFTRMTQTLARRPRPFRRNAASSPTSPARARPSCWPARRRRWPTGSARRYPSSSRPPAGA